ncbi:MAG: hypothetical protein EOO56_02405 [Hymenobacter sp.]|nr:MAG: hypothetical protein EOO56_02405 [Hymenobacter sp.]
MSQASAYADTSAYYAQPGSYRRLSRLLLKAREQKDLRAGTAIYAQLRRLPLTAQLAISASTLATLHEYAGQPAAAF